MRNNEMRDYHSYKTLKRNFIFDGTYILIYVLPRAVFKKMFTTFHM